MLIDKDISIHLSCQQFECSRFDVMEDKSVLLFSSSRNSGEVVCPFCGGRVHVHGQSQHHIEGQPLWFGVPLELEVELSSRMAKAFPPRMHGALVRFWKATATWLSAMR